MQRIALISEHASPLGVIGGVDAGGQNIYVANVAKQLAERGLDVDVYTRCDKPHLPDTVQIGPRMRVIHVPAGPPVEVPKERLLPYMRAFADHMIARMRCEPDPVDVMHANFFMSGDAGLRVKQRLGIPLVTTFHALGRVRRLHQGAADGFPDERFAIEDTLARRSDRLIAECPQDALDLKTHYHADAARIEMRAVRVRRARIPAGAARRCARAARLAAGCVRGAAARPSRAAQGHRHGDRRARADAARSGAADPALYRRRQPPDTGPVTRPGTRAARRARARRPATAARPSRPRRAYSRTARRTHDEGP